MTPYATKQQRIAITGADALVVRSLRDDQQFSDPHGTAASRGISPANWPLFGMVWPSGLQLADRLAARPVRAGERILEVGCGLALASLVGHRRGADVTACDVHPLAAAFLRENVRLNGLPPLRYRHGPWGEAERQVGKPFDLVIGSDLLYEPDGRGTLAHFLARHAAATAEVWIVDPDRGNRGAFHRHMLELGFLRQEERCDAAANDDRAAYRGRIMVYRQRAVLPPASIGP
jgi:predicted nicotinamide N-methyase